MQGFEFSADPAYVVLIVGALFVHACYQLSVSVLTHLSAHTLSRKASVRRLSWLGSNYTLGVIAATTLLLIALVNLPGIVPTVSRSHAMEVFTALVIGLLPLVGLATVFWYYRRGKGTQLWLPRPIASFLLERSAKTKRGFEAFLLGAGTVVGELPFIIAPLLLVALLIASQPAALWLAFSVGYGIVAALPLLVVTGYLTSGHSVARIQRWREQSKTFLQWTSGLALMLLTLYLTVVRIGASS